MDATSREEEVMDVTVTGRHCTISDTLREQVETRLSSITRLQDRAIRAEVEFTKTDVKGSPDQMIEAEITLLSKGPVVRAEATADDKTIAFEKALERLKSQLRKAADRRKHRRGLRTPEPLVAAEVAPAAEGEDGEASTRVVAGLEVTGDGPLVVREKEFTTTPLNLAQALDEMELVGHDFFLYQDAETGRPSVVYRRKAYDYGVIHLAVQ